MTSDNLLLFKYVKTKGNSELVFIFIVSVNEWPIDLLLIFLSSKPSGYNCLLFCSIKSLNTDLSGDEYLLVGV